MIFREVKPCKQLEPLVRKYLLVHHLPGAVVPVENYPTRIEQSLVFFARGCIKSYDPTINRYMPIASNALFGQQTNRLNFYPISKPDFLMVMVVFQPGALYRLLGISTQEFSEKFCDAEMIMSSELQNVNDGISNALTYESMLELVEDYLLNKMRTLARELHPIDNIAQLLLHNPSNFSMDWLCCQANLSPRQFERKFNEHMGIGPKLYARISRFYKALQYKERNPAIDWAMISFQFGYSDYCHLAKDFKEFTNVTPSIKIDRMAIHTEAKLVDI
ncbi:MAG: AraC family transcriptional regulator [Bacteroidetes bacterium]|nr:AraC family transcriptional regulator [Bacteroidota bacterium]MBS1539072.1 AraC family transcriptional regulator [Bacteroidota bacterium]